MDRVTASAASPLRERRAGMTLVEIMIATVLLAIGLLGMLALQSQALRGSQLGRHYTDAAQVGRDEMERLLRLEWDDMVVEDWTVPVDMTRTVQKDGEANATEQTYQVSHRVVDDVIADPTLPTDVRTVDVRVTWYEASDPTADPPRRRFAMTSSRFNDGN
jgi:prepilin-type N-terminal cleavage/methylation domain-containing protein